MAAAKVVVVGRGSSNPQNLDVPRANTLTADVHSPATGFAYAACNFDLSHTGCVSLRMQECGQLSRKNIPALEDGEFAACRLLEASCSQKRRILWAPHSGPS